MVHYHKTLCKWCLLIMRMREDKVNVDTLFAVSVLPLEFKKNSKVKRTQAKAVSRWVIS